MSGNKELDDAHAALQAAMPQQPVLPMAARLIAEFEGFSAVPYRDIAGVWTIGYGSTRIGGEPVTMDTLPCTETDALVWLTDEARPLLFHISAVAPTDATNHQLAACISLAYNVGLGAFMGSALLHSWTVDDAEAAVAHFNDWIYYHDPKTHELTESSGLKDRRGREAAFFGTPD